MPQQHLAQKPEDKASERQATSPDWRAGGHRQGVRHPTLQQSAGNLAIQRKTRTGSGLPVSQPGDIHETEADEVADRVVSAAPPQTVQRKCACGSGETCADCAQEQQVQPKRREGSDHGPGTAHTSGLFQSAGRPLTSAMRSRFEPHFGQDLQDVRIHDDRHSASAARSLNARAFTVGRDIGFDAGEYSPHSLDGQRLLAHELTHVVQQKGGSPIVARQPAKPADQPAKKEREFSPDLDAVRYTPDEVTDEQLWAYNNFVLDVYVRSDKRLSDNIAKLDEWRSFIDKRFSDDLVLKGQLGAGEANRMIQSGLRLGRTDFIEPYFATKSPASRLYYENVLSGKINGGCQACHESNVVWQWNAAHHYEFDKAPTTAQNLAMLADYTAMDRMFRGEEPGSAIAQMLAQVVATPPPSTEQQAPSPIAQVPAAGAGVQVDASMQPPAAVPTPERRSDLCGELPKSTPLPPFNPASYGPQTVLAVQAIQQIRPVLEPLGPSGYRILPEGIFSTLYNRTPAELRADVMTNLDKRQSGFRSMQGLIAARKVPYMEFCPVVDELLGRADKTVEFWVLFEIYKQRAREAILDILMAIAGVALLFLAPILAPVVLVAAGAAMGAIQVAQGIRDYSRGSWYGMGMGAGIFSKEQEASAESLRVGGLMSMGMGAIGVGLSAVGGLSLLRARPMGALPAVRGPSGEFNLLADGSYVAFHPENPNLAVMLEGDRLTAGIITDSGFVEMAQAKAPWGSGPPPRGFTANNVRWQPVSPPAGGGAGWSAPHGGPLMLPETAGSPLTPWQPGSSFDAPPLGLGGQPSGLFGPGQAPFVPGPFEGPYALGPGGKGSMRLLPASSETHVPPATGETAVAAVKPPEVPEVTVIKKVGGKKPKQTMTLKPEAVPEDIKAARLRVERDIAKRQGREEAQGRLRELAYDPTIDENVRNYLKKQVEGNKNMPGRGYDEMDPKQRIRLPKKGDQIVDAAGNKTGATFDDGWVLGHPEAEYDLETGAETKPAKPARDAYDYSNTRPITETQNKLEELQRRQIDKMEAEVRKEVRGMAEEAQKQGKPLSNEEILKLYQQKRLEGLKKIFGGGGKK